MRFAVLVICGVALPWLRPLMAEVDSTSVAIGALCGGAAGLLPAIVKALRERKDGDRKDRQSDQSFIASQYRKVIAQHERDCDSLQQQLDEVREKASVESHGLRDRLQQALLSEAVVKERCNHLEQQLRELRAKQFGEGGL